MKKINHEYTNEIVCPYCGYEFSDSWEYSDDGVQDCGECEKTFSLTINRSVDYITEKLHCANGEGKHSWWLAAKDGLYRCSNCEKMKIFENETRNTFEGDDDGK